MITTELLVFPFEVDFASKKLTEELNFSEWGLHDCLVFAEVVAGFVDFGDIDFIRTFEVFFKISLRVPEDLILLLSITKR